jgi:uncharacterized phage-associated protein
MAKFTSSQYKNIPLFHFIAIDATRVKGVCAQGCNYLWWKKGWITRSEAVKYSNSNLFAPLSSSTELTEISYLYDLLHLDADLQFKLGAARIFNRPIELAAFSHAFPIIQKLYKSTKHHIIFNQTPIELLKHMDEVNEQSSINIIYKLYAEYCAWRLSITGKENLPLRDFVDERIVTIVSQCITEELARP